jgi:N-dimethylarginine dimethylaminohydrolase
VTEYVRNKYTNEYDISRENIEFSKYVSDEGYKIIKATNERQEKYGINFLNLGDSNLITVDESTSRSLIKSKMIKGNIDLIDYNAFVKMYGSVHCCSQVLSRECNYDD